MSCIATWFFHYKKDRVVEIMLGDWIKIPTHQKHSIEWTSPDEPTVWLAVFYEAERSGVPG